MDAGGHDPSVRWTTAGFEDAFTALEAALSAATWPEPPNGFETVGKVRSMRTVLRGVMEASDGPVDVVVKWSRPDRLGDHVSRQVRGGKGPREGEVLRALAAEGVAAPEALAYTDDDLDLLVTRALPDLAPLPPVDGLSLPELHQLAELLAAAHAAGLRHRDLHADNVAFADGRPLLVDLGSARVGRPLDEPARVKALARLRHAAFTDVRRTQRLRALTAYLHAAGDDAPRTTAHALADGIEARAQVVQRNWRKGRDRRATRSGRHFQVFGQEDARGIRCRDVVSAAVEPDARRWLDAFPTDATELKAGGRVARWPYETRDLVGKRFDAVATGRTPRAERTFRRAFALQVRGLPVPPPVLAISHDDAGLYVAQHVEGTELQAWMDGGRGGAFARLPHATRVRFLRRLGRLLRALHDAEVSHRDLKPPNLLVVEDGDVPRVVFVDLDGVRIRRRPVRWRRRARDLARLDAGLAARRTDRLRVFQGYWDVLPRPTADAREFLTWVERRVRRKRGPSGLPR